MSTGAVTPFQTRISPLPRASYPTPIVFSSEDFKRQDESPDTQFYSSPRFVHHIDDSARARLEAYYNEVIPAGSSILDICSSWTSHLPQSLLSKISCVGYGLNAAELNRNSFLSGYHVHDLNADPQLKETGSGSVDAVICNVSIDYLNRPIEVLQEINRVLKPGGTAHFAFSNRCFPTKVVAQWLRLDNQGKRSWVGSYFWAAGGWEGIEEVVLNEGGHDDPLFVVRGRTIGG